MVAWASRLSRCAHFLQPARSAWPWSAIVHRHRDASCSWRRCSRGCATRWPSCSAISRADNVFAFHLTGDPYQTRVDREARRKPLEPRFAPENQTPRGAIRDVAVQVIVPPVINGVPSRPGSAATSPTPSSSKGFGELASKSRGRPVPGRTVVHRDSRTARVRAGRRRRGQRREGALRRGCAGRAAGRRHVPGSRRHLLRGGRARAAQGRVLRRETATTTWSRFRWGPRRADSPRPRTRCSTRRHAPASASTARTETEVILRQLRGLAPGEPTT